MTLEHRAILQQMRSAAGILQGVVNAARSGRFNEPPYPGEQSKLETLPVPISAGLTVISLMMLLSLLGI